jgi:hypothetical protein
MNALTPVSDSVLEQVIGTGNLKALNPKQRVEYMLAVCESRGLNPLTRPFRFMEFQGAVVLYATRDCADQLRKVDGISTEIVSKGVDGDLYVVEVTATDKTGRRDSDVGAVVIGSLRGEARANAIMKATTKAKRRVTLSICGLGILDETEVHDMRGAVLMEDPAIDVAQITQPAPAAAPQPEQPEIAYPFATSKGGQIYRTGSEWFEAWRRLIEACVRTEALDKLQKAMEMNSGAIEAVGDFDPQAAAEVREMLASTLGVAADIELQP